MSPMRYFINAAINTDDIVVPLNIHHDHGYAKLSSQSCMPSSTDHGSLVNVDDTSDVPVSLSPSSDHSVCNSQKENSEDSDPESVVADDSDITDDDSSSSDTNEKQRKCGLDNIYTRTYPIYCIQYIKTPIQYSHVNCTMSLLHIYLLFRL